MSTNYSAVLGARALRSVEAQPASVEAPTPGTPRSRPDDIDSHRIGQHKTVIVGQSVLHVCLLATALILSPLCPIFRCFAGVGGASGSGKTSICEIVKAALKDDSMVTLSFDSYYIPLGGKDAATHNFDEPSALDVDLLAEHLQALKVRLQASVPKLACHTLSCAQLGKPIRVPLYDFTIHDRVGWSEPIQNPSVVFLDGIFTICCEKIRYCSRSL